MGRLPKEETEEEREIPDFSNQVHAQKMNLFGPLKAPSKEEEARNERKSLLAEMRATIIAVMEVMEKQRPDQQFGMFWDMLDETSQYTMLWDWFNRVSILDQKMAETGAMSLEGLMKLQQTQLGVDRKNILPLKSISQRMDETSEAVVEGRMNQFKHPVNPRLQEPEKTEKKTSDK